MLLHLSYSSPRYCELYRLILPSQLPPPPALIRANSRTIRTKEYRTFAATYVHSLICSVAKRKIQFSVLCLHRKCHVLYIYPCAGASFNEQLPVASHMHSKQETIQITIKLTWRIKLNISQKNTIPFCDGNIVGNLS